MKLRTFQQITLWFLLLSMSVLASGKNWTKPQLLANNEYVSTSSASVNANGTAAAIWAAGPVNNTLQVQASLRPSGGAWSKPFPLTKGLQFGPGWPFSLNADTGSAIATFGGVISTQIGVSTETIP